MCRTNSSAPQGKPDATSDPKALVTSENKDRVLFPIVIVSKPEISPDWSLGTQHEFSGAMVVDIKGDQSSEAARLTHAEWREKYCGAQFFYPIWWWDSAVNSADIQRIIQVDNKIYTFSRFGVMQFDADNFSEGSRLEFQNSPDLCQETRYGICGSQ